MAETHCKQGESLCSCNGQAGCQGNGSLELDPQTCCQVWKTLQAPSSPASPHPYSPGLPAGPVLGDVPEPSLISSMIWLRTYSVRKIQSQGICRKQKLSVLKFVPPLAYKISQYRVIPHLMMLIRTASCHCFWSCFYSRAQLYLWPNTVRWLANVTGAFLSMDQSSLFKAKWVLTLFRT